jgi:hypothetical protein
MILRFKEEGGGRWLEIVETKEFGEARVSQSRGRKKRK